MDQPITVAVDAMGGDNAPAAAVEGALEAVRRYPHITVLLVGQALKIEPLLAGHAPHNRVRVLDAPEVIGMDEAPTAAIRQKKNSSLVMGLNAVKAGEADAFVSAGNTGALLTGATVIIGRRPGVERPALGTMLPNTKGFTLLIDSGANMDAKPSYLAQFAVMGTEYVRRVAGNAQPRVGLLNVGAEAEKGNALTKEAYALLKAQEGIRFIGNVEAREIPFGAADVAVCDAFAGNVVLKYTEGFAKAMLDIIKSELTAGFVTKAGALLAKPAFRRIKKRFDHREVGGAPFLGLNALVVKAHGSSDAYAMTNAIGQCVRFKAQEA